MGKVVLDIHRKRTHTAFESLPLHDIRPIHPIDRGVAKESLDQRILAAREASGEIGSDRRITRAWLHAHLPSVSEIKVVKVSEGRFVSYEGNGRLGALQAVFGEDEGMAVEVEVYHFAPRDLPTILRRINRVRRWNGLGALRLKGPGA